VISQRLVIVGGKGGVGKSTVAAALALALSDRGLRTAAVEAADRCDVARLLNVSSDAPLKETEVGPHLNHVRLELRATLEDYLREEVSGPLPAALLLRSRGFQGFIDATPGMQELLTIGKVWELTQRPRRRKNLEPYDVVLLDGPATGQLLAILEAPRTFGSIARVGPVARQASAIQRTLLDPEQTAVVIVTTPEQMAVTEALDLHRSLEAVSMHVEAVVINRAYPSRFNSAELSALSSVNEDAAVRSARWLFGRARAQQAEAARLRRGLGEIPRIKLPFLFTEPFDRGSIERLGEILARGFS
jgi:anion-transporting  ArsA/GET3 family ATPase